METSKYGKCKRVLIVEDDDIIRALLSEALLVSSFEDRSTSIGAIGHVERSIEFDSLMKFLTRYCNEKNITATKNVQLDRITENRISLESN